MSAPQDTRPAVVITGASSGIGRALAGELAAAGWRVFAGFRDPVDGESLRASSDSGAIEPLRLDVTSDPDVRAARERLDAALGERGLDAVVHCAAVVVPGPLELLGPDDLRESLETNLIGVQRVTVALLPVVRRARGRLVCVSSISGRVGFPFEGAYNASKFALEGWADTLRRELQEVDVVLVEPGPVRTPIWGRIRARLEALRARTAGEQRYRDALDAFERELDDVAGRADPVERVAAAIGRALRDPRPRARYVVGRSARLWSLAARFAPSGWVDRRLGR